MRIRQTTAVFAAVMLLAGCGGSAAPDPATGETAVEATTAEAEPTTTAAAEPTATERPTRSDYVEPTEKDIATCNTFFGDGGRAEQVRELAVPLPASVSVADIDPYLAMNSSLQFQAQRAEPEAAAILEEMREQFQRFQDWADRDYADGLTNYQYGPINIAVSKLQSYCGRRMLPAL